MKDYTKFMKWAVVSITPRDTQDDRRDKANVEALLSNPVQAQDIYLKNAPNQDIKRYILHVEDLDRFEKFYNFIGDLKESYGINWIYNLDKGTFTSDEENRFRTILDLWTN